MDRPGVVDSSHNHPVSAYVDFSNVAISRARLLKSRDWATTIIEGAHGPLGVAGSKSGLRFVQLSFDLLQSDFPLRVGFPVFITNCLDWLVPAGAKGSGESIRTGQPMYVDVPPDVSEVNVQLPNGRQKTVKVTQLPIVFDDTELAGVYRVRGKGVDKEFTCNLASSAESDIMPRDVLSIGGQQFKSSTNAVRTNMEMYGFLVFIALGLLTFEWYAYHRRI